MSQARVTAFNLRKTVRLRRYDLNQIVRYVEDLLPLLLGNRITVEVDVHEDDIPVMGDTSALIEVLINIVENASDAMPDGGRLTIGTSVSRPGNGLTRGSEPHSRFPCAQLIISDTGTGMDKETMGLAFEPFFTTRSDLQKDGLGLTVAKTVIERHEGTISLESHPGKGTTVRITLPMIHEALAVLDPIELPSSPQKEPPARGKQTLTGGRARR